MTKTFLTDLRVGDTLKIGDVAVTVINKSGRVVRLSVLAPDSTKISKPCAPANLPHQSLDAASRANEGAGA